MLAKQEAAKKEEEALRCEQSEFRAELRAVCAELEPCSEPWSEFGVVEELIKQLEERCEVRALSFHGVDIVIGP